MAAIGTVLVLNTQDTADHKWSAFFPRKFSCVFTEDTSIAYLEIRDVNHNVIQKLLNITSGTIYDIKIDRPISELYFVPDDITVEKKLSITNITMDGVSILKSITSAGLTSGYNASGNFILTDGTPANMVWYDNLIMTNGVISGLSGLIPDSLMFFRLILKGYVIGYITGNTETTITTSLIGYSDSEPKRYCVQPNIGTMPLAYAGIGENILPYVNKDLTISSLKEYTAPPIPMDTSACLVEHTSSSAITTFASSAKQRLGLRKDLI